MISRLSKAVGKVSLPAIVCAGLFAVPQVQAMTIEDQRALYEQAQEYLDNRNLNAFKPIRAQLDNYPLTPYLDYRAFLHTLKERTPAQVNQFIKEYEALPFSKRLRGPYLNALYVQQAWSQILAFQTQPPKGQQYQCIYHYAQYKTGDKQAAFVGAQSLWLNGKSVADECDHLFKVWRDAGKLTDALILERMLLAFDSRKGKLMTYLMKLPKGADAKAQATAMKALFNRPESVAEFAKDKAATDFNRTQTEHAFKKLARKNVAEAQRVYDAVMKGQKFSVEKQQELAEYVAFRLTNTSSQSLAKWRDNVLANSERNVLLERRARLAIQHGDWKALLKWIDRLDAKHQDSLRWQYWRGRAEIELGQVTTGEKRLVDILGQRNFYSAAAAKELNRAITYPTTSLTFDKDSLKAYQTSLLRIEELIATDKIAATKSEWHHLLTRVNNKETQAMLAAYAYDKRWHHLSVKASIKAKIWGNLDLRFPIAHSWWFNFYGDKHDIDPITLMSLARQESAMDVQARSPVGARGIMQIMPKTAKYTARKYKLAYKGTRDLYEVGKNIEIGSHYLNGLLEQYDNNRIFALAAYNAGPHRVKTWRKRTQGKLDPYAFIEAIPFKETRGYVQNILMFETYYRNIMGVEGAFLNPHELKTKY